MGLLMLISWLGLVHVPLGAEAACATTVIAHSESELFNMISVYTEDCISVDTSINPSPWYLSGSYPANSFVFYFIFLLLLVVSLVERSYNVEVRASLQELNGNGVELRHYTNFGTFIVDSQISFVNITFQFIGTSASLFTTSVFHGLYTVFSFCNFYDQHSGNFLLPEKLLLSFVNALEATAASVFDNAAFPHSGDFFDCVFRSLYSLTLLLVLLSQVFV